MKIKLHSGLQYLILSKENYLLDSVAWNIFDHAYRLSDNIPFRCRKHELENEITCIYPGSHMVEARIKGQVIVSRIIQGEKQFARASADSPRTYDDI
jgi:hypothetical protein